MDPHIFSDPDPESQNLADPTDPDPKHFFSRFKLLNKLDSKFNSDSAGFSRIQPDLPLFMFSEHTL